jgi:hypothetical protein
MYTHFETVARNLKRKISPWKDYRMPVIENLIPSDELEMGQLGDHLDCLLSFNLGRQIDCEYSCNKEVINPRGVKCIPRVGNKSSIPST